jgi:phenylacetate-coenzyme A ligase PaaK-like adenylate-forming protein
LHIDEDAVIIEVVEKDGHALPSGERGAAILATNLYNKTFPFIRYRVSDMMTLSDAPCPCGVNFARITSIEGRHTEMLRLRGTSGKPVTVHPWVIERSFESLPGVGRFKIHTKGETATVRIVPRNPPPNLKAMIESALTEVCIPVGVASEAIRVEIINQIDEESSRL